MSATPHEAGAPCISFAELARAVEVLTGAAKSGPRRMTAEEADELRAIMVEAVKAVQLTASALHRFLLTQAEARTLIMQTAGSDREPDQLAAVGHAVIGCLEFLETFREAQENGATQPMFRLLQQLGDVQRGRRSPLFEPVQGLNRSTSLAGAALKGLAACALDARREGGQTITAAAHEIAARFIGVPLTRGRDEGRKAVTADTITGWRKEARKGELTPHEAQRQWNTYAKKRDATGRDAAAWRRMADQLERKIIEQIAGLPPSFTISGSAEGDASDKRSGVRPAQAAPPRPRARG
jgi:hypothetical protein